MKKLLVPLLCLLSSFAAHADSTLWLEESNGNKREFCLSDQPKVTFADREILLYTDNSTIYLRLDVIPSSLMTGAMRANPLSVFKI